MENPVAILKLSSLTHLRNLDAVKALRELEFADVYFTNRLENADGLLELPLLRKIDIFALDLKLLDWHRLVAAAAKRGIRV